MAEQASAAIRRIIGGARLNDGWMLKAGPGSMIRGRSLSRTSTGALRRLEFDPAKTWRLRRSEEIRVLSAMERRFLLNLLAQIEASSGTLGDELFISARRVAGTELRRSARSLALMVQRGLLIVSNQNGELRALITREGRELIHRWFAANPPDFNKRFPLLYRELGLAESIQEGAAVDSRNLRVGS
jgi:hypothetical protein